ncbi:SOD5 Cell surface Cu-only superoxide dismutase 5 [Candida maltosa Xu316]
MKYLPVLALLASYAIAGDAPISTDSTDSDSLVATFKKTSTSNIEGTIKFEPAKNGTVLISLDLTGFPSTGGPFPYHIHEMPVPESGNCTATGMHFNPFNGSATATTPAALELGDLAGRHGNITGGSVNEEIDDNYISLNKDSKAYIGGLSVVIHSSNNTRLTCSNLELLDASSSASNSTSSGSSTSGSSNSSSNSTESSSSASAANGVGRNELSGVIAAGVAGIVAAMI